MILNGVSDNSGKHENKYEYAKTLLEDSASKYIYVPLSIILDNKLDAKRIGVLSYLRIHCGLNDIIGFTVSDMVEWNGMKPNKRIDKTNDKFLNVIEDFRNRGYLTYLTEPNRSSYMKCKFNTEYYYDECSKGYAVIYLDELEKIMSYKNLQGNTISNVLLLLAFSYFRYKIRRRPNELKPEERTVENIKLRQQRLPDAFDSNITAIAEEIGIHKQTLSKVIDILEDELKLIVTDRAYRIKNEDGEFRTLPTIFANAYKREDKYLLVTGNDYGRREIELKAENIKQHYQGYKIDKRKRKNNIERRKKSETTN